MYNKFAKNDKVIILLKENSHIFFITFVEIS